MATFECKSIVNNFFFFKSQGPHYWRSNHSDCPGPSFETSLSQRLISITLDKLDSTVLLAWHSTWQPCGPFPPSHPKRVLSGGTLTSVWPACDPLGCTGKIAWHLCPPPRQPRESVSADFIGLVIPSATTSHAASHWVMETMRATDTDIISGLIRAAQLFPHVSVDIPSPWGYPFGTPAAQLVGKTAKGAKVSSRRGCNLKSEERGFFFLIIIISSISDWRIQDSFWSVQRWCQGII